MKREKRQKGKGTQSKAEEKQPEERPLFEFWWTHRTLTVELKSALSNPYVEGVIQSCKDEVKARARVVVDTTTSPRAKRNAEGWKSTMTLAWHKKLVEARNQLLSAFTEAQGKCEKDKVEGSPEKQASVVAVSRRETIALHQKALHIVLDVIFLEWKTHFDAAGGGDETANRFSALVDCLLEGIAFTHVNHWICASSSGEHALSQDDLLGALGHYLQNHLKITFVEQIQLLPKFVQRMWELFHVELLELEETMLRSCGTHAVSGAEGETGDAVKDFEVRSFVSNVAKVLRKLYVETSARKSTKDLNNNEGNGYVVVATSSMAGAMVQSLGRWLPVCGDFLHSMLTCFNALKSEGSAGGDSHGVSAHKCIDGDKDSKGTECPKTEGMLPAAEARGLLRGLQQEVQRVFVLLEQLDEFTPWPVLLADIASRTFHAARERVQPTDSEECRDNANITKGFREHTAMRAFLSWHSRAVATPLLSSSNAMVSRGTPLTLVEACSKALNGIISSALDKTSVPSDIHKRALRVLLVHRPLATLQHLIKSLCATGAEADRCDFEAIITDRGMSSASRSTAFSEATLDADDVAFMFFPKFFAVANFIESSLASLCEDVKSVLNSTAAGKDSCVADHTVNTSQFVERLFAAALEESIITSGTGSCSVAVSEWLMFLGFVASDSPLFEKTTIQHVRLAARRFFAPGLPMMSCLHRLIRQRHQYGLVAFFLPPLRAIGVDHSTAKDAEHVACALRYPRCAEVAYLEELPRGYYSRQPQRLALNAKNDALQFFHNILMTPGSVKKERDGDDKMSKSGGEKEKEVDVVRRLFVEIVAHIGELVMARLRGVGEARLLGPTGAGCVVVDAMTAFFMGVMRLCNTVTYWDVSRRQQVQKAIVEKLLSRANVAREGPVLPRLALAVLLQGNVAYDEEVKPHIPHAWCDYLCSMELEDIDSRANVCAMNLLRLCNRNYMKSIPTKTLLACRAMLEQPTTKEKDISTQEKLDTGISASVKHDFDALRQRAANNAPADVQQQAGPVPTDSMVEEKKEVANTTTDTSSATLKVQEESTVSPTTGAQAEAPIAVTGSAINKGSEAPASGDDKLLNAVVKPYMDAVITVFVMRARTSVADAVLTGIAVKKWLISCAGNLESRALLNAVRRIVLQANAKVLHATKMECTALAAFLGVLVDEIVLPYRLNPCRAVPPHGDQQKQPPTTAEANVPARTEGTQNNWIHDVLPASGKDAAALLQTLIMDTTRNIARFLGENTSLGDWKAYTLTFHMRRVVGLVRRNKELFLDAVKKRQQTLGIILSTDSTHPVNLLASVECPLLERMTGPAVSAEQLFMVSPDPKTSVAARTETQGSAGVDGRTTGSSKRKRDRENDHEADSNHDHRHGRLRRRGGDRARDRDRSRERDNDRGAARDYDRDREVSRGRERDRDANRDRDRHWEWDFDRDEQDDEHHGHNRRYRRWRKRDRGQ
ncbi:uncharacterized protein TEOVI_000541800 [Trypanosoma equiperdum]|uniref:Uncharacterized protein n=1 Tax=Trypanosoma equiperdum TaxID=5694 RepID=A0A1G4I001_TRYEQ|nr:hypothetical protein, conserved [Trypanosoma equiperdum]